MDWQTTVDYTSDISLNNDIQLCNIHRNNTLYTQEGSFACDKEFNVSQLLEENVGRDAIRIANLTKYLKPDGRCLNE